MFASLANFLTAIDRRLRDMGLPPVPRNDRRFRAVRQALAKICGPRDSRRSAIAPALPLDTLSAMVPRDRPPVPDRVAWFAFLLMRALLLRPAEVSRGSGM